MEVYSTYILHGVVEVSAADDQEEGNEEELKRDKKPKKVHWHADTYLGKPEVSEAIAEPADSRLRSGRSGVDDPTRSPVFAPRRETTYRKDVVEAKKDRSKNPKGKGKGKCKVPD